MRNMAQEYAKQFYTSPSWLKCRASFISHRRGIDGGICQRCGERLGFIVHHIEHITPENINDPSVTLSFDNLEYVCLDCHNDEHRGDMIAGRGGKPLCTFDADGQPHDRRRI